MTEKIENPLYPGMRPEDDHLAPEPKKPPFTSTDNQTDKVASRPVRIIKGSTDWFLLTC